MRPAARGEAVTCTLCVAVFGDEDDEDDESSRTVVTREPVVAPAGGGYVGAEMNELPLQGGRVTVDVVRVGDTVRRPRRPNSEFVRLLLQQLEESGFEAVPRYLGEDDQGREMFSFLAGEVPPDLIAGYSDQALAHAARLIRRYHDATVSFPLAKSGEVVCQNDLSPCNFVFRDGLPRGIIDFDAAAPGTRLEDLGYALFLWLNIGTDGPPAPKQARRIRVFCDAYGIEADEVVIKAIADAVATNIQRLRADDRQRDVEWWQKQLDWIEHYRAELLPLPARR